MSLFLVLVSRILLFFRVFPRFGNPIGFRGPLPQVDQLAPLRAKRPIRVIHVPDHELATLRTVDNGLLHAVNPDALNINRIARFFQQSVQLHLTPVSNFSASDLTRR